MRRIVEERWLSFTEPLEGGVPCLYNDIRGLTTIAYGNLVNSPGDVTGLPFVHPDGQLASYAEIVAAWHAVHDDPLCAKRRWTYAATLTPLRLTPRGMRDLAIGKLRENDVALAKRLPFWEDMPACAQMAIHSLAWACGPAFHFPRLMSALNVHDYESAAVEIHMNEWTKGPNGETIRNNGLIPRNDANKILMTNAARVETYHLDTDFLDWKKVLTSSSIPPAPESGVQNAASQPTIYPVIHPVVDQLEAYRKLRDDD